jgi:outer membrane immunogenic protein
MMKQFSIATLAAATALAWVGVANAADMPVKAPPPPPPIYDWSGFYVGFHEGYEWASVHDVQISNNAGNGFTGNSTVSNAIAGFHVGIQRQFAGGLLGFGRAWVIGLEGGLNEPLNRNNPSNFAPCVNTAFTCGIQNFRDNWYGGGRLGLAFNLANGGWLFGGDYLFTVSGGFTTARFQRSDFLLATGVLDAGLGESVGWHNGGYVGVGLEHVWARGVLVDYITGIDYQHQFYGNQNDTTQNFAIAEQHTLNADVDMVRLRTTLKFH